jgi:hypothetical protein
MDLPSFLTGWVLGCLSGIGGVLMLGAWGRRGE